MKKSYLSLFLSGILSFVSFFAFGADENTTASDKNENEPLEKETSAEIVKDAIKGGEIKGRDVFNIISRIDDERIDDRSKYADMSFLEGYVAALTEELNDDPLFWAWEEYDRDDIVVADQMLNAGWDIAVAKFPYIFGRLEKTAKYVKRRTTWKPKIRKYKFKINPELDDEDFLHLRVKLKKEKSWMNDLELKLTPNEVKLGKSWDLEEIGRKASFGVDGRYNWEDNEYTIRATLKVPFWFRYEREKEKK